MALEAQGSTASSMLYSFAGYSPTINSHCQHLLPIHEKNGGFREHQEALFLSPPGSGWVFHVDDEPLEKIESPLGLGWYWRPAFFAGEVTAQLIDQDDKVMDTYLLDVAPSKEKLGRHMYRDMIDEIWAEDPQLVLGSEPSTIKVGESGSEKSRLIAFARIRQYGPSAIKTLSELCQKPIHALHSKRELLPIHKVRRADRRTAMTALSVPDLIRYLAGEEVMGGARGELLDVPETEPHLDCAANRCITAIAQGLLRSIVSLSEGMERDVSSESASETRTELASRWPVRKVFLENLNIQLRSILKKAPYSEVTRVEITAAGLNAVSAHPLYSRAYRLAWMAQRVGVSKGVKQERLWISPTWEIYENWCYVRLVKLLKNVEGFVWTKLERHKSNPTAAIMGADTKGNVIRFFLQPTFASFDMKGSREFYSLSGKRIPDIALTIETPSSRQLHIYDAKYRSSRQSLLDAMSSAHLYRDALRWNGVKTHTAILLAPAANMVDWLLDEEFQRRESVGIHELTLGGGLNLIEHIRLAVV